MNMREVTQWLSDQRDAKNFKTLKQVRDHCRTLINVTNKEWYADGQKSTDLTNSNSKTENKC